MKVIILDNFFITSDYYKIANFSNKFLLFYKKIKLMNLINKILKSHDEISEIKIITTNKEKFQINGNIKIELASEFRLNIDRTEFKNIRIEIIKKIKWNLRIFFEYLNKLKSFHIKNISIGKIFEAYLDIFLGESFGGYELVKKILQVEKCDRVILFNPNPNFLDFFKKLSTKKGYINVYQDNLLLKVRKIANLYRYAPYLPIGIFGLKRLLLEMFWENNKKKKIYNNKNQKNIIFLANTQNQYKSIKPIYDHFKKEQKYNPIFYQDRTFLSSVNKYTELLKTFFRIKRIWNDDIKNIFKIMEYDTIEVEGIMKEFYEIHLFLFVVNIFNNLYYFDKYIQYIRPAALILAEELSAEGRLYARYCKIRRIPTIYVPHAALPIYNQLATKTDFNCITVPGDISKEYLINRGESKDKIYITGRARYDFFFQDILKNLPQIEDMFNKKVYQFDPNKYTILFTTNPIDSKATEKQLTVVVNVLKKLNLIDNLIIKLHPRENGLIYKEILKKLNVNPIIVKDYDIFELIKSSKVLLTMVSTTILEAMIIGIPIILLDFINLDFSFTGTYEFCQEKYLLTAYNQEILLNKLQELINNKDFYNIYSKKLKEYGRKFCFHNEKTSSTKIIHDLILKTIEKNG